MSKENSLPEFVDGEPLNNESLELLRGELHHTPSRDWDRRFLATIAVRDKRIEELEGIAREYGQHKPNCLTTTGTPDGVHADEYCTCNWTSIVCHRIARQALDTKEKP